MSLFEKSLLLLILLERRHHDFGNEIDDRCGGLFRFQFGEDVAGVLRSIGDLPRHETEDSNGYGAGDGPSPLLRVQPAERHRIDRILSAEEQFPRVVRDGDPLSRHFEMDANGRQLLLLSGE